MSFSIEIKHNYLIPENVINRAIDEINKKQITFGVHSEDNNNHFNRDKVQNGTLHKMLYNNGQPIEPVGNAELLRKTENGYTTVMYYGRNREQHMVIVPSRPLLQPILLMSLQFDNSLIIRGIKNQFKFKNPNEFNAYLTRFGNTMDKTAVFDFVKGRGMGFWDNGEHNSPYVQAVKYFDTLGDAGLASITNKSHEYIKKISGWDTSNSYNVGDTPLMDSLDLLNSIKSKVEDR